MNVPVVVLGLIAVAALVPESRAVAAPGLDPVGIGTSVAGLVGVTYGLIEAGQHGWGDAGALASDRGRAGSCSSRSSLWERRLSARPGGQPLVDLRAVPLARLSPGA